VPDFEIRYFRTDGTLAIVHVTSHETIEEAELHAQRHQKEHARFELHEVKGWQRS
jgi:hypothetical protein